MRTISSVASANAEGVGKRPFGRISLGLGSIVVVGVLLLVVGEASIAARVHDEELLEAEQPRSPLSFRLRWEVHHPLGGLAYVPLHVWVFWAGFRIARGHVARHKRAGLTIFFVAVPLLVIEHVLRGWLSGNGVYIGIPMNVFPF
jgi:hypothetical protein